MIGRITGNVVEEQPDGTIVVDVHGVGYELLVPLGSVGRLRATAPDGPLTFHVHTHVREDIFQLFGFASAADRLAFRTLIGVSSVGPKSAIAILSSLPAPELAQALSQKQIARLVAVPGIGKKIAERLILELRDKISLIASGQTGALVMPANPSPAPAGTPRATLVAALTNLGYKPAEAERAIEFLGDRISVDPMPTLIRDALAFLRK